MKLLWRRQPIAEALDDTSLSEQTRERLRLVARVREFARDLGLEVDDQYTSYVDWPGDRIVTTLVRTHPDSLEPVPFWFPFVGALPYKGYFDRDRAEAEAERLRAEEDFDVCVSAIPAYSTLGWFDDPVTSPMLAGGSARLVETLLHELVHSTAFLKGEADFNESVAQFIGQQATIRFFETHAPNPDRPRVDPNTVRDAISDRRAIARVIMRFRDRLVELEADSGLGHRRALEETRARAELAALPLRVLDAPAVAEHARLSNACLALRGTYVRDLPRHARVLEALGGDLERMIVRLRRWAETGASPEEFFRVDAMDGSNATPVDDAESESDRRDEGDRPGRGAQCPINSTTPSWTSPRKTARQASVSTSASWAPSISLPV